MVMPSVSVIMVSYHTGAVLEYAIAHVLAQAHLAELIIVDNGNPPEVAEYLQLLSAENQHCEFITGHGNVGFAKANNIGARAATGEFILLLNPDCLLPENAFSPLIEALNSHPKAMLAGANIINADGTPQRASRRELLTPETAVAESLKLHKFLKIKRLNIHETPLPQHTESVPAISGACMFLRKSTYDTLGGFDERYFLHVEDMDFCMRIHQAGGEILFVPSVQIVHLLSTSNASSAFIECCKAKSFILYFRTHFKHTSRLLLTLAELGIWVRYAIKRIRPSRSHSNAALKASRQLLVIEKYMSLRAQRSNLINGEIASSSPTPRNDEKTHPIILTGATSQIGLILLAKLLASGNVVYAISRKPLPFTHAKLYWVQHNFASNLNSNILPAKATLIHCAGLWHAPSFIKTIQHHCEIKRLVAFSSTSIFGKANSKDVAEQKTIADLSAAEASISAQNIPYTILRPTLVYGVGLDGNVSRIARTIQRFGAFPVFPPARGLRQPVHAEDLANAALTCLQTPSTVNKIYNLSGGETLSYRNMVERIFTTLHKKPRIIPLFFLNAALDLLGYLRQNSKVNGQMAKRMNEDLIFPHTEATQDFAYAPRPFLSAGTKDLGEA